MPVFDIWAQHLLLRQPKWSAKRKTDYQLLTFDMTRQTQNQIKMCYDENKQAIVLDKHQNYVIKNGKEKIIFLKY